MCDDDDTLVAAANDSQTICIIYRYRSCELRRSSLPLLLLLLLHSLSRCLLLVIASCLSSLLLVSARLVHRPLAACNVSNRHRQQFGRCSERGREEGNSGMTHTQGHRRTDNREGEETHGAAERRSETNLGGVRSSNSRTKQIEKSKKIQLCLTRSVWSAYHSITPLMRATSRVRYCASDGSVFKLIRVDANELSSLLRAPLKCNSIVPLLSAVAESSSLSIATFR